MKSNYPSGDKVTAPLAYTIELAFTNHPAKWSQMLFLAGNNNHALCSAAILAVLDALYAIRTIRDPKKGDGGSNRNLNGESEKETMLSEKRVLG